METECKSNFVPTLALFKICYLCWAFTHSKNDRNYAWIVQTVATQNQMSDSAITPSSVEKSPISRKTDDDII